MIRPNFKRCVDQTLSEHANKLLQPINQQLDSYPERIRKQALNSIMQVVYMIDTGNQKRTMTDAQARRMEEFDQQERILALQLANLHERRREYINQNELNKL